VAKGKRLKKDLSDHKIVGLDTGVFIQHFEGEEYSELTTVVLERVQDGHCKGVVSTVSLAEVLVKPLQMGLEGLADLYRVVFHEMPNLQMVPVDQEVASRAASLRVAYGLGPADSLVLATALEAGSTAFVTTRPELKEVKGLQVMVLDEYL
jgi:predicted nucleic acid-binding protein